MTLGLQLPSVNIPTIEVNFEVIINELQSIDETKSSLLRADMARKIRNAKISTLTS